MIDSPKPALTALALGVLVASAGPAAAQDRFAGQDALRDPSVELSEITGRVEQAVSTIMAALENPASHSHDNWVALLVGFLNTIEVETRGIIDAIKGTSPYMRALDDARVNLLMLQSRYEREPPSQSRDARVAVLAGAVASIESKSRQISAVEATLTTLLSETLLMRAQLLRRDDLMVSNIVIENVITLIASLDRQSRLIQIVAGPLTTPISESVALHGQPVRNCPATLADIIEAVDLLAAELHRTQGRMSDFQRAFASLEDVNAALEMNREITVCPADFVADLEALLGSLAVPGSGDGFSATGVYSACTRMYVDAHIDQMVALQASPDPEPNAQRVAFGLLMSRIIALDEVLFHGALTLSVFDLRRRRLEAAAGSMLRRCEIMAQY